MYLKLATVLITGMLMPLCAGGSEEHDISHSLFITSIIYQLFHDQVYNETSTYLQTSSSSTSEYVVSDTDKIEYTVLMKVSLSGNLKELDALLASDNMVNDVTINGVTALMLATQKGNFKVVQKLLNHKADIHVKDKKYGTTALHLAVVYGHVKIVNLFLIHGANVNEIDIYGQTPLMVACKSGHNEIISLLIKNEADINRKDIHSICALIIASYFGHLDIVELLLAHNATIDDVTDTGHSGLMVAAQEGHTGIIELLIKHGADVNKVDHTNSNALMKAAFRGHKSAVELLLNYNSTLDEQTDSGHTALMAAVQNNHTEIVEMLLKKGANISKSKNTNLNVLMKAAFYGHVKIVQLLLKHNASVNDQTIDTGHTALMAAAQEGHTEIAELLIQHGADVNKLTINNQNALLLATKNMHKKTVKFLLEKHTSVDVEDNEGFTALMAAAQEGHDTIAVLLLEHGADINKITKGNQNALMMATYNGYASTVQQLLNYGPRVNDRNCDGFTAIMLAAHEGYERIVDLLLKNGADIYIKSNDNENALTIATKNGHKSIVEILLKHSVNVDETSSSKNRNRVPSTGYQELILWMLFLITLVVVTLHLQSYGKKLGKRNSLLDQPYQENIISTTSECFYKITETPLHLKNVWGCDKTCQANESGFFRLLNFRGKFHSATLVQEVSPNCYGCLITSVKGRNLVEHRSRKYLEYFLCLQYIQKITKLLYETYLISNININKKEKETCRMLYKHALNIIADLKLSLGSTEDRNINRFPQLIKAIDRKLRIFSDKDRKANRILKQMCREKQNQFLITEPQLICSMLGLNNLFENYLLELDLETINHQTLVYFINRWLENTVQAIEETDRSISLYDCMLRIGLSEEKATNYIGYLCEEFINMYSSLYWLSRYFENLCLMNPLITEIPKSCIYEGNLDVWENCEVRRETGDGESLFNIKRLNLKSPSNIYNEEYKSCCNRVKNLRKKCKEDGSIFMYHGTSLTSAADILEFGVDLKKGRPNMDFSHSKGFYLIEDFKMAAKWSGSHKPNNHAVIIFKVKKEEFDNGNGLELSDEGEWRNVVRACRKGFRCAGGPQVRERLSSYDYVSGCLCANGSDVQKTDAVPLVLENGASQPIQTCIVKKKFAKRIGEISNVCGIVIFRAN